MSNEMHLCDLVIHYDNPMGEGISNMAYPVRRSPEEMMTLAGMAVDPGGHVTRIKDFVYSIVRQVVRGIERNGFSFYYGKDEEMFIPPRRIRAISIGPQLVSDDEARLKMCQVWKLCLHCKDKSEIVWEGRTGICKHCGRTCYYVPTSEELEANGL